MAKTERNAIENRIKVADCPNIVLVADFGDDLAEAECRLAASIIWRKNRVAPPDLTVVNDVRPFNRIHAAFTFHRLADVAPAGTVFIGVIDPGVGTTRRSVIVKTERQHFFVGPDNGIFYPVAVQSGLEGVWEIDESRFPVHSTTFYGRDIFSKVAAEIACGINLDVLGRRANQRDLLPLLLQPGQIVHVDAYGNIKIWGDVPDRVKSVAIRLENGHSLQIPFVRTFEDVAVGQPLAYLGSSGLLEIAIREDVNCGAADRLGINIGDQLNLKFEPYEVFYGRS